MPDRPRRALVIGRFQPPHRGHVHCFEQAARAAEEMIVAIGSAQRSHTRDNPFTAGERIALVAATLKDTGLGAAHVVPVPDLDQYHLWLPQVQAYVPAFDVVVTGSPMTAHLFEKGGIEVVRIQPTDRRKLAGTEVRRRLFAGEEVTDLVTPSVAAFLDTGEVRARLSAVRTAAEGVHG